jgi:hypothetical protein
LSDIRSPIFGVRFLHLFRAECPIGVQECVTTMVDLQ